MVVPTHRTWEAQSITKPSITRCNYLESGGWVSCALIITLCRQGAGGDGLCGIVGLSLGSRWVLYHHGIGGLGSTLHRTLSIVYLGHYEVLVHTKRVLALGFVSV